MIWIAGGFVLAVLGGALALRWGMRWGSTAQERADGLPGDECLEGRRKARVVMTRAITVDAPPQRVWPWVAQLGRGAGWYSIDWLDNGRRASASHIVSWIPAPSLGDATAIGYLRHVAAGSSLVWWLDDARFLGSAARSVTCFRIRADGHRTRLISRISADANGPTAQVALLVFRVIDSIMAVRQLTGLRNRVEQTEEDRSRSKHSETGRRDQYQLYEILYAGGDRAGVPGKESGAKWRRSAVRDGVLAESETGINRDASAT